MRPVKPLPDASVLWNKFDYSIITGELYHKHARARVKVGDVAGRETPTGHRQVKVNGERYYVHRIIIRMITGEDIPQGMEVDHINNNSRNNAWHNLRVVSHEENLSNLVVTKERGDFSLSWYQKRGLPVPERVREEYNKKQNKRNEERRRRV